MGGQQVQMAEPLPTKSAVEGVTLAWVACLLVGSLGYLLVPWAMIASWIKSPQDVAAWDQAVGSIGAVVAVFAVWRLDRIKDRTHAVQTAKAYARSLVGAHGVLIKAAKAKDVSDFHTARKLLAEAYLVGQAVPLGQLTGRQVTAVVELRARTVVIMERTERESTFESMLAAADESARSILRTMVKGGIADVRNEQGDPVVWSGG
jgi:hypothetical protein